MSSISVKKKWHTLQDRVSRAYYDYGRLCSAHPYGCLVISMLTTLFLSCPAFTRIRLPDSNPVDVFWSHGLLNFTTNERSLPEWLKKPPAVYVQQIVVRATVTPWNSSQLTPEMVVKAALSRSFTVTDSLQSAGIHKFCLNLPRSSDEKLLPSNGCLVLSPTKFWDDKIYHFYEDSNILETLFETECTPNLCYRDILLGTPARMAGIKKSYQTNRHRSIHFAVTLFQTKYNRDFRGAMVESLSKEFEIEKSSAADEHIFVRVFYRPRKYLADYLPLLGSYVLCMLYFYYVVSKFEMVKSKWGLAIAAFLTVFFTLTCTAGICMHFELTPTLWGAGLYPYLAMIFGLENILCITRSVVYTAPSMDVASRLSHGFSYEGYSITKFFLMELVFLFVGYLTFVSEIQEFCTFAFIGLVVDFYMQLFFYAPCLTLDLLRLDKEEKLRFSLMLFNTDMRKLRNYPNPTCPAKHLFPWMFKKTPRLARTFSDTNVRLKENPNTNSNFKKSHRRAMSTDKINVAEFGGKEEIRVRKKYVRLWILYYWTKTRFVQRILMGIFAVWVLCFGLFAHKFKLFESSKLAAIEDGFGMSHRILEMAPLEWSEYRRHTFKWWPDVFAEYNMTLSGRYITFIPPIVMNAEIPLDDLSLTYKPSKKDSIKPTVSHPEPLTTTQSPEQLKNRVYWLERQMTLMLVCSILLLFSVVVSFILYVCFWDKWISYRNAKKAASDLQQAQAKMKGKKHTVELVPLAFFKHESPVECVSVMKPNTVVSASLDGRVLVWDAQSGVLKRSLTRAGMSPNPSSGHMETSRSRYSSTTSNSELPNLRTSDPQLRQRSSASISLVRPSTAPNTVGSAPTNNSSGFVFFSECVNKPTRSQIWCMSIKQSFVALGCSNGTVEISKWTDGQILTSYDASNVGVLHITIRGNRIVLVRLNGLLEVLELSFSPRPEDPLNIRRLVSVKAHQEPVTQLLCASYYAVTASQDHTIKAFDIRTMRFSSILSGHSAPVMSLCVDEQINALYSCCDEGVICYWDLDTGLLARNLDNEAQEPVDLACTSQMVIGYGAGSQVYLWDKFNGNLITRITPTLAELNAIIDDTRCIVVLSDQVVATSNGKFVQFWDVNCKAIIRQLKLPGIVDSLHQLDDNSVLCCSSNNMYRVNLLTTRESSKHM